MKKLILILFLIGMLSLVNAAYYVTDPTTCPTSYLSQGPFPDKVVCGESGGTVFFYNGATIAAPTSTSTSNTDYTGIVNGGYVLDCYRYSSPEPYCEPARCDRSSTCYTTQHRDTLCTKDVFGVSTCENCRSGYYDCAGDITCEVQSGVTAQDKPHTTYGNGCATYLCSSGFQSCEGDTPSVEGCLYETGVTTCETVGGEPGVIAASCTCQELPQEDFITNTFAEGFGSFLLWGNQTKTGGWLINLFNIDTIFIVNDSGVFFNNIKFINYEGDNIYILSNSTSHYLNEIKLNQTIADYTFNISNSGGGNESWNESYADTLYTNQTYVDAQNIIFNDSIASYVLYVNGTMKAYVDSQDISFNESMFTYVNAQDVIFNDSIASYVVLVNNSMASYVISVNSTTGDYTDAQDIIFNNSMTTYVDAQDSIYNLSMFNYANSQDIIFNNSIANYVDIQIGLLNYGDFFFANFSDSFDSNLTLTALQSILNSTGIYSTYNSTYAGLINNGSYLSTYNSTYDTTTNQWDNNFSILYGSVNNVSYLSTYNATYDAKADYQFTDNNFNGSGNISTTGDLETTNFEADYILSSGDIANRLRLERTSGGDSRINLLNTVGAWTFGIESNLDTFAIGEGLNFDNQFFNIKRTTGNIGIGTVSPSQKLDVRGKGNFSDTIYIFNNTDISTFKNNNLWATNGTSIYNSTVSQVGIGTITPARPLEIVADADFIPLRLTAVTGRYNDIRTDGVNVRISSSEGTASFQVGLKTAQAGGFVAHGSDTGSAVGGILSLNTALDNGSVIGSYKFSVDEDNLLIGPLTDPDSLKYRGATNKWEFTGSGVDGISHADLDDITPNDHHAEIHAILSHDTDTTGTELTSLADNSIADTLHRHSELVASDGSPDPALIVDATGQVGIGNNAPLHPLHLSLSNDYFSITDSGDFNNDRVRIGDGSGDGAYFALYNDASELTTLLRSYTSGDVQGYFTAGNIGIGTSTPDALLDVSDSSATTIRLTNTKNGAWSVGESFGKIEVQGDDLSYPGIKGIIDVVAVESTGTYSEMVFKMTGYEGGNNAEFLRLTRNSDLVISDHRVSGAWTIGNRLSSIKHNSDEDSGGFAVGDTRGMMSMEVEDTIGAAFGYHFYTAPDGATGLLDRLTIRANGNIGIGTSTPTYPLEVVGNVSGISIWSDGNVSATGYITRTSVFDKESSPFNFIKDADYYLDSKTNEIDHSKFYGYAGEFEVTDYLKPEIELYEEEVLDEKGIIINVTKERIIYPYKIIKEGVELGMEIDVLRQAVYELNEEGKLLKEDLCSLGISRWCTTSEL